MREQTARVRLRPVDPGDLPAVYAMHCDPQSNELAGTIPYERDVFFARWEGYLRDPSILSRVILEGDAVAGTISVFKLDGGEGGADALGYWIDRARWGRGIASRAVGLMLEEFTARPLAAHVASDNAASLRVLGRHGFVEAGRSFEEGTERYLPREVVRLVLRERRGAAVPASEHFPCYLPE